VPTPVGGSDVLLGPTFAFASLAFLLVFVQLFLLRSFGRAAASDASGPLSESQNRNEYKFSVAAALGLAIAVIEAVTLVNIAAAGSSSALGLSESSPYTQSNETRVPTGRVRVALQWPRGVANVVLTAAELI